MQTYTHSLDSIIIRIQHWDPKQKGAENLAPDHLSRLENPYFEECNEDEIQDSFLDEFDAAIQTREEENAPWFADFANYLAAGIMIKGLTHQ